jgi:hypothetical protein
VGFENPVVGGTALRIPAIQSPNYDPGVAGWIIKIDGSAEFNNLTVRGEFRGTNFIINSSGIFLYSGTPALGNLVGSWTTADGTDQYGNGYIAGLTTYGTSSTINLIQDDLVLTGSNGSKVVLESAADASVSLTPGGGGTWFAGGIVTAVSGTSHPQMELFAPADTTNDVGATLTLEGSSTASVATAIRSVATLWSHLGGAGQIQNWWIKQNSSGTAFTWQTPSYGTNWAASTTFNGGTNWHALQYRLDAEDNLWLIGGFKATGAVANPVFTLPSGYRPAAQWPLYLQQNNAGALTTIALEIAGSGNVNILNANGGVLANGNEWLVNAKIPMGNIS